jgi:GxxExxY protein
MEINKISGEIIGAAIEVHNHLGPGLLENTYQRCLQHELIKRGLEVQSEVGLPVVYKEQKIDLGYRIDLLVEEAVIVELKTVDKISQLHRSQLFTYLKLSDKKLGLLLNFNSKLLKDGIVRMANSSSACSQSSAIHFYTGYEGLSNER